MSTQTPDLNADWWTIADVAAYLNVNTPTVDVYSRRRGMPKPSKLGHIRVWRPSEIQTWHANRPGQGRRAA